MGDLPPLLAHFGDFVLDEGNARLAMAGRPVVLQPKAFALLCALVRQPGRLLRKDDLLDAVWGHRHVSESVLKTTISQLRSALADDAKQPRYIETASRLGYRFIAPLGEAAPAPLSVVLAAHPPPDVAPGEGIVGRQAPLAALQRSFAAARQRRRQLVFVAGEAGIGKSTLIDSFLASLGGAMPAHALGQCVEHYGAGEAYMPVLEALNVLCREPDGGPAWVARMRQVAPSWLVQLPWFLDADDRQRLQREVAGATQDRMLREFGELIDRSTTEQPLLLVLEDLHWSDQATVALLGYLARRRSPAALMLVASFRPAEIIAQEHPLAGLRHELRLHRLCEELDLESFSEAEVGELVAARRGGRDAPEAFVQALHAHTEGLPLFVVSLLEELAASGRLPDDDDDADFDVAALGVPEGIVGVVEKQIDRLPPDLQQVLGAASVLGAEFNHAVLAGVLQVPPAELQATLDAALARGPWLRGTGVANLPDGRLAARYAFGHALYRHVYYQRLGDVQRLQWHRAAAAALLAAHAAQAPAVAGELAMHFERGGEPRHAATWLAVVGARAMGRSAPQEALRAVRHGLALLGDQAPPELALDLRVLEGVALTRTQIISRPEVAAVFEQAHQLAGQVADSPARARAMQGLWWVSFARGDLPAALSLAERIHGLGRAAAEPGLKLAGHNAMGMTLAMRGEFPGALGHLAQSVALYREVGSRLPAGSFVQDPGVEAMGYLGMVSWWTGDAATARRECAAAVALAREIRHPISELIALNLAAVLHMFAGETERALALIDEVFATIDRHQLPRGPGSFGWVRGTLLARLGRVDEGLAQIEEGERSTRDNGMRIGLGGYFLQRGHALRLAGRPDEAAASIEAGLAHVRGSGECAVLSTLLRHHAEDRLARGDAQGAARHLREALDVAVAQGARFHELLGLACAHRLALPGFDRGVLAARGREIAAGYRGDPAPSVAEALTQLEGSA